MTYQITIKSSPKKDKKLMAVIKKNNGRPKTIHFGAVGYSDFTKHHDIVRKKKYILRHRKNEDWALSGIYSAGFWSRWVLWNKWHIEESLSDIEKRFKNVRIFWNFKKKK